MFLFAFWSFLTFQFCIVLNGFCMILFFLLERESVTFLGWGAYLNSSAVAVHVAVLLKQDLYRHQVYEQGCANNCINNLQNSKLRSQTGWDQGCLILTVSSTWYESFRFFQASCCFFSCNHNNQYVTFLAVFCLEDVKVCLLYCVLLYSSVCVCVCVCVWTQYIQAVSSKIIQRIIKS